MGNATIPSLGNLNGYAAKDAVGMIWKAAFLRSRRLNAYQKETGGAAVNRMSCACALAYFAWPLLGVGDGIAPFLGIGGIYASLCLADGAITRLRYGHQEAGRLIDAYGEIEKDAATMYARGDITVEEARILIAKFRHANFSDNKHTYLRCYVHHESDERNFSELLTYRYDGCSDEAK